MCGGTFVIGLEVTHFCPSLSPHSSLPRLTSVAHPAARFKDDPGSRRPRRHALRPRQTPHGQRVRSRGGVRDGGQALLFLETHRPKLVILDCHMPCLDGFAVLGAVRSDAALADLPVIMFSADAAAKAQALRLGAQGFILKGSLDWAAISAEVQRYAGEAAGKAPHATPARFSQDC